MRIITRHRDPRYSFASYQKLERETPPRIGETITFEVSGLEYTFRVDDVDNREGWVEIYLQGDPKRIDGRKPPITVTEEERRR